MNQDIDKKIEVAYPEAYRIARRFHEFYEQSAPAFGYETKKETKEFDPESPNGRLMAWVCYEIVKEEVDKCREDTLREVGEIKEKYNELIMTVAKKYEGETRHQTALKYIQRAEANEGEASSQIKSLQDNKE